MGSTVSVFHLWLVCRPGELLQPHLSCRESSMVEPVKKFSWTTLSEVKCLNLSITQTQEELKLPENTSSRFYPDSYLKLFCLFLICIREIIPACKFWCHLDELISTCYPCYSFRHNDSVVGTLIFQLLFHSLLKRNGS